MFTNLLVAFAVAIALFAAALRTLSNAAVGTGVPGFAITVGA